MKVTSTVICKDRGLKVLQERFAAARDLCVTVGWHASEGARPKDVRTGKGAISQNTRINLASVATVHEFGSPANEVPARPVHLTAYRNGAYRDQLVKILRSEYRDGVLRGKPLTQMLQRAGDFWRTRFDLVFDGDNAWQPLSSRTLDQRSRFGNASTDPLVDTRQMRNTTTSRVRPNIGLGQAVIR